MEGRAGRHETGERAASHAAEDPGEAVAVSWTGDGASIGYGGVRSGQWWWRRRANGASARHASRSTLM